MNELEQLILVFDSDPELRKYFEISLREHLQAWEERDQLRAGGTENHTRLITLEIVGSTPTPVNEEDTDNHPAFTAGWDAAVLEVSQPKPPEAGWPNFVTLDDLPEEHREQKPPEQETWRTRKPML